MQGTELTKEMQKLIFFRKLVASTEAYTMQDAIAMDDLELTIVAKIVASVREQEHKANKSSRVVVIMLVASFVLISLLSII